MTTILARYDALVKAGELRPDPDQRAAAERLCRLQQGLEATPARGSTLWKLLRKAPEPPRGLYMWGGVGRGKSMLMDLFFDTVQVQRKKRAHFHEFMLDVHARLAEARKSETGDPIPPVVESLAEEARLLCFDEMVVNNMADAAIMSRLFTGLLDKRVTIVTTSNRVPDDLYKDGLNRQLFLPFIDMLGESLEMLELDAGVDYRLDRLKAMDVYITPANAKAESRLNEDFRSLSIGGHAAPVTLQVQGREIIIPMVAEGVAMADFKDLCEKPLGPGDYLEIASSFHTLVLKGIPKLGSEKRDVAKRFVTLIDALYEANVNLICSANAPAEALYTEGDGAFEFERTVSRLKEMQSADYMAQPHAG